MFRRQDLLSSAMLASQPHFARTPCCISLVCGLPFASSTAKNIPVLDRTRSILEDNGIKSEALRELIDFLANSGRSITFKDQVSFSETSFALEDRLLHLKVRKSPEQMMFDHPLEACPFGLIYLKCVLKNVNRVCPALQNIEEQLKSLLIERERKSVGDVDIQLRRGALMWAMFMGGVFARTKRTGLPSGFPSY